MRTKLTKAQKAVFETLTKEQNARIIGCYFRNSWKLIYSDGGFSPTAKTRWSVILALLEANLITRANDHNGRRVYVAIKSTENPPTP